MYMRCSRSYIIPRTSMVYQQLPNTDQLLCCKVHHHVPGKELHHLPTYIPNWCVERLVAKSDLLNFWPSSVEFGGFRKPPDFPNIAQSEVLQSANFDQLHPSAQQADILLITPTVASPVYQRK